MLRYLFFFSMENTGRGAHKHLNGEIIEKITREEKE